MGINGLPAFRPTKRHRQFAIVIGLCAVFQAAGADAYSTYFSSTMTPGSETAESNMRQKLIKRLKPADPESTEIMLADRGMDCLDQSKALS